MTAKEPKSYAKRLEKPIYVSACPSDLSVGSRLTHGAQVIRSVRREIISRAYNVLLRVVLAARFSDAQCGFKAARTDVIKALLPAVEDDGWFFDTELLMLAQRQERRIYQVPVTWTEDPDSKVKIVRTALADLRGMARLRFRSRMSKGRPAGNDCRSVPAELTATEQPR